MTVGAQGATGSIVTRMIRASRLESEVYEEVEHDRDATLQAALVIVITSLAAGIGSLADLGFLGFIGITIAALVGWAIYAWLTYFVGTRFFAGEHTRADWGELARALGFANSPRVLLVLGIIPVLGAIVGIVVAVWVLIATVIAVRAALDFSTGRAIGTALVAWLVQALIFVVVYAVLP